jgi:hypothetical protein
MGMRLSFIVVRYLFGVVLCLAVNLAPSFAADATFSKDGKHLYVVKSLTQLFDVDIEKQSASEIEIGPLISSKPVGEMKPSIVAVSASNSGDLVVATAMDAWSCNIEKKVCSKICDAPEGVVFEDMACDPKGRGILFRAGDGSDVKGTFFLERGTSKPLPLYQRSGGRLQDLDGMTFSPTGELYFGTHGALWYGIIAPDEVAKDRPEEETRSWYLAAKRIAPLAQAHDVPNVEVELAGIAIGRTKVYALLNRHPYDSGHVTETVVCLPKPKATIEASTGKVGDRAVDSPHVEVNEIASVRVPADMVAWHLCASRDGKRVFYGYVTNDKEVYDIPSLAAAGKAYLIENDGNPRELKVKLPEQASPTATAAPISIATPIRIPTPFPTATRTGQKRPLENEPDYMKRLKQQVDEIVATPRPSQSP